MELVNTTLPWRFSSTSLRMIFCVSANGAKKFVSNERRRSSIGISLIGPLMPMAALLTRMSISQFRAFSISTFSSIMPPSASAENLDIPIQSILNIVGVENIEFLDAKILQPQFFGFQTELRHLRPDLRSGNYVMSGLGQANCRQFAKSRACPGKQNPLLRRVPGHGRLPCWASQVMWMGLNPLLAHSEPVPVVDPSTSSR